MKSKFLTKKYTQMLHGVATLMMIYHHLYEKPLEKKSDKCIKRYMPKRGSYKKAKS